MPYLDSGGATCAYWPAYGRAFNMLNDWRSMSRGRRELRLLLAVITVTRSVVRPEEFGVCELVQHRSVFDDLRTTGVSDVGANEFQNMHARRSDFDASSG